MLPKMLRAIEVYGSHSLARRELPIAVDSVTPVCVRACVRACVLVCCVCACVRACVRASVSSLSLSLARSSPPSPSPSPSLTAKLSDKTLHCRSWHTVSTCPYTRSHTRRLSKSLRVIPCHTLSHIQSSTLRERTGRRRLRRRCRGHMPGQMTGHMTGRDLGLGEDDGNRVEEARVEPEEAEPHVLLGAGVGVLGSTINAFSTVIASAVMSDTVKVSW